MSARMQELRRRLNPQIQRPILRFSQVVHALGASRKTLRNWLDRDQIELFTPHHEGRWRTFSVADLMQLALMRALVDWGASVREASETAHEITWRAAEFKHADDLPLPALVAVALGDLAGAHLLVWRDGEGVLRWAKAETDNLLREIGRAGAAALVLNLDGVVQPALARATEFYPGDHA